MNWQRFCIVGIGGHARTKLIPAIEANGQKVAALVSRQVHDDWPQTPTFATLQDALSEIDRDVVVVIASPPALHFEQVIMSINSGFDVIVEKPAFLSALQADEVATQCDLHGNVLVEAFMQRHTGLYNHLIKYFAENNVVALDLSFVIPAIPTNTFRNGHSVYASSLYDIGCYVLALLDDLGLALHELNLSNVRDAGTMSESLELAGTISGIKVTARIGVDRYYENSATVRLASGIENSFYPLFYGRPALKTFGDVAIQDVNAFAAMFEVPRDYWVKTQDARFNSILRVTRQLEVLATQLTLFRSSST